MFTREFLGGKYFLVPLVFLYFFQDKLLTRENERREMRRAMATNNDVWEYRNCPPKDWNEPLPERLQERPQISQSGSCTVS